MLRLASSTQRCGPAKAVGNGALRAPWAPPGRRAFRGNGALRGISEAISNEWPLRVDSYSDWMAIPNVRFRRWIYVIFIWTIWAAREAKLSKMVQKTIICTVGASRGAKEIQNDTN